MINTSDSKARARAERETEAKAKRRATQAQVVAGLQTMLESDEQLLGFSRGLIAGGLRGKLTVGFEALFAPYVNIGLTERRIVLQHIHQESGKPSEILPHSFPLSEIASIAFSDIETFGAEPAGRLTLRLYNDQHFRLRVKSEENAESARNIADVFATLTATRPKARTSPTQSLCPHCDHVLDRVSKFCPYCGQQLETEQSAAPMPASEPEAAPFPAAATEEPVAAFSEQESETVAVPFEFDAPTQQIPADWQTVEAEADTEPSLERTQPLPRAEEFDLTEIDEPTASFSITPPPSAEVVPPAPADEMSTEGHEAVPQTNNEQAAAANDSEHKGDVSPQGDFHADHHS
jgi:hypothetical protein